MNGRFVLDTNVVSAVLRGEPQAVSCWLSAEELMLPVPVLGELLYGVRGGSRADEGERKVWALLSAVRLMPCDREVADYYARIKDHLRRRGRPIPDNDIWIAAICHQSGGVLASRYRHFDELPDLPRDEWR